MEMGKGNDTVRFGADTEFKGKSTLDLGPGGKDAVILESADGANGKLTITNVGRKDTITVGDETSRARTSPTVHRSLASRSNWPDLSLYNHKPLLRGLFFVPRAAP